MSEIFPRLDPKLSITNGIEAPTAVRAIEAIKQDIVMKLSQIGLGNQVNAEVIAKLEDGSFIAKVADMPMRLDLPLGTRVGDQLALRLNRLTPRVGFLLEKFNQAPVGNNLTSKSANANSTIVTLPSMSPQTTAFELPETAPTTTIRAKTEIQAPEKLMAAMKQEAHLRLSQIGVNNTVKAEVLSKLPDGSYTAKVAGMQMRLNLPAGTQIGENLSLRLSHLSPQVSFSLETASPILANKGAQTAVIQHEILLLAPLSGYQDLEAGVPVLTAASAKYAPSIATQHVTQNATQHAAQIASYVQTSSIPLSTQTDLSSAGQLISHLLSETAGSESKNLRLPENRPLIANSTIGQMAENLPALIENTLKNSITHSGLSYESHLVDFLQGKKSFTEISQEPQAKINQAQVVSNDGSNDDSTEETVQNDLSVLRDNVESNSNLIAQSETMPHEIAEIVRQQLDILEHNKLTLTGMLAPHMPFTWEVIDDSNSDATNQHREHKEPQHHSFLKVDLPHLGVVSVDIDLQANRVHLSLKGQSDIAVQELRSHLGDLSEALALSGNNLQSFKASRDE